MIDRTLIDKVAVFAKNEKEINNIKSRLRIRGKITAKSVSKKGNLKILVKRGKKEYTFTILKTHKEKFIALEKIPLNTSISMEGISTLRAIICTRFKVLKKGIDESSQKNLLEYHITSKQRKPQQPI